jgi:hypothetical protein
LADKPRRPAPEKVIGFHVLMDVPSIMTLRSLVEKFATQQIG